MPYRKSYRRRRPSYRKRSYKRPLYKRRYKRRVRPTSLTIPNRGLSICPDTLFCKLRVTDVIDLAGGSIPAAAGEPSIIRAYLNVGDLTNPLGTFSTDQPCGVEEWGQFYNQYVIHKSSILVTPITITQNVDGTPTDNYALPYQITVTPIVDPTVTALNPQYPMDEQPYARNRQFNNPASIINSQATFNIYNAQFGNNTKQSVFNSMMTKKIRGIKDLTDDVDSRGVIPAPTSAAFAYYWCIEVKSLIPWDGVSSVTGYVLSDFAVRVTEIFNVQFLNRIAVEDTVED